MIVGIGIDLVEISRIRRSLERFGNVFTNKMLHPSESELVPADLLLPASVAHVAGRFAAKEAAVKALGTGFSGGIGLHDVRISSLPSGQPLLTFHGKAQERAIALRAHVAHISLSHSRVSAGAVVGLASGEQGLTAT